MQSHLIFLFYFCYTFYRRFSFIITSTFFATIITAYMFACVVLIDCPTFEIIFGVYVISITIYSCFYDLNCSSTLPTFPQDILLHLLRTYSINLIHIRTYSINLIIDLILKILYYITNNSLLYISI